MSALAAESILHIEKYMTQFYLISCKQQTQNYFVDRIHEQVGMNKSHTNWDRHEPAVLRAQVELSVHLRDLLRRPKSSDLPGLGPYERVAEIENVGSDMELAIGALRKFSVESADTNVIDRKLTHAIRSVADAVLPILEFFEAQDILDSTAAPQCIGTTSIAMLRVLSAFASLRSKAYEFRIVSAFLRAIELPSSLPPLNLLLVHGQGYMEALLDAILPGLLALIDTHPLLVKKFGDYALHIAKYVLGQTVLASTCNTVSKNGDTLQAVCIHNAEIGASVLRALVEPKPAGKENAEILGYLRTALCSMQRHKTFKYLHKELESIIHLANEARDGERKGREALGQELQRTQR